jgi:hypothetical protein
MFCFFFLFFLRGDYLLTKLGLSWISARSKHPKQDKEAQALYKKQLSVPIDASHVFNVLV